METVATPPPVQLNKVPGAKILLMGDSGTGKTHAIRTLVAAGITPFIIATEQNCVQTLKDLPPGSWHYKYISPIPEHNFDQIQTIFENINKLSYENLTKSVDPNKSAHRKLVDVAAAMNNFTCDCCKKSWGHVSKWNTDRALCFDGLSGISDMAMALVVGNKPVRSMPDWGVAQNSVKMLLNPLTTQTDCWFVLVSHIDREKDEITGGTNITVKTLGQKLGPDLPRMFSDVIRTRRDANKFVWDTADAQSTVVARHLPIASSLEPSFVPLVNEWKKRGGKIEVTQEEIK